MNENREGELFDGENEILRELEHAYLTAYPNPQRVGCPSPVLIEQIVSNQLRPPAGSEIVRHLTHCSPCFKVFIDARNHLRSRRRRLSFLTSRPVIAAAIGLAILAGGVLFWGASAIKSHFDLTAHRKLQPADRVASIHVDLQSYSIERSGSGTNPQANIIGPILPIKAVNLNLALPVGFETGVYDVRISRTIEGPALVQSQGTARLIDHVVQLDQSGFRGNSSRAIFSWNSTTRS